MVPIGRLKVPTVTLDVPMLPAVSQHSGSFACSYACQRNVMGSSTLEGPIRRLKVPIGRLKVLSGTFKVPGLAGLSPHSG